MEISILRKSRFNLNYLVKTGILLALALTFQIGLSSFAQPAVGPMVNMTLLIATIYVGPLAGIIVGSLTPIGAFLLGIMPLLPVVFFIMGGNAILVILFSVVRKVSKSYGDLLGVLIGAFGKFAFLAISIRYIVIYFVPKVPPKLIDALSIPQLYTAIIGGLLALIIAKRLPKTK